MARRPRSFETLLREKSRWMMGTALHLTGNMEDAKELMQEASYRSLKGWRRYDAGRPFTAWIGRILWNLAIDIRRRKENQWIALDTPRGDDDETLANRLPMREEGALERLEKLEREQLVKSALRGLSRKIREVAILCDMKGLKYREAAAVLEIPIGTVRSRLSRARQLLRQNDRLRETTSE